MAIVTPANVAPDTLPRVRGAFLVYNHRGQWIAMKWPRKRGPRKDPAGIWTSKSFGYAGKMAANAEPMSYETARYLSEGSHWLPRDLLTMVAFGKFYEVYLPDGTLVQQAPHGLPVPYQPTRDPVRQWYQNGVLDTLSGTPSTSAWAFKGWGFIPTVDMAIEATSAVITPINGAMYKAVAVVMSGANVITAVTPGTILTLSGTVRKPYEFPLVANFTAGTRCAVLVGRVDGTGNYALPLLSGTGGSFQINAQDLGGCRIAQTTPAIGHSVNVSGAGFAGTMLLDY